MKLKLTKAGLLAVASLALASCGALSGNRPVIPVPERCSPAAAGELIPEPVVPTMAGIVAPCDPGNPPIGAEPAQCEAERAATAAYLASDAERSAWGRLGWSRLAQVKAECDRREKAFEPQTNRAN